MSQNIKSFTFNPGLFILISNNQRYTGKERVACKPSKFANVQKQIVQFAFVSVAWNEPFSPTNPTNAEENVYRVGEKIVSSDRTQ